jgi:hypothetical protein
MNQLKKQLLCLAVLVSTVPLHGALNTTTNIVPRSQSFNAARQIVGWDNSTWGIFRKANDDSYFTSFNLTFEYSQTFRNNRLTTALFGDDLVCAGCDNDLAINISGSLVPNRGANDWLADYFGLPANFQSTVAFNPKISNFILDFNIYTGLDAWTEGLYFWIYAPFVHTKWNLNATECIGTPVSTTYSQALEYLGAAYPAGYFSSTAVSAGNTTPSFLDYANGATPTINAAYGEDENVIWQPLCCSRMINSCDCACDNGFVRNGFGEIRFILGRNFFGNEDNSNDCHLGVGVYAAAPTGTRVGHSKYLFEPIVGNGKHWELGGQITGHHICWRSQDDERSFGVYFEANITHLFGAQQTRCFDLCSAGSSSRYMLAQNLEYFEPESFLSASGLPTLNPVLSDSASLQFANEFAPVANLTRRQVTSSIGAQGDLAISFAYQAKCFQWELGYNFWGRSCEKLRISNDCCPVIMGTWALKGNAYVYGFDAAYSNLPVALAASDSGATIHNGTNSLSSAAINITMDNSVKAVDTNGQTLVNNLPAALDPFSSNTVYTSNPPVIISEADFNLTGTRGISNKLFGNVNWAWDHCNDGKWSPYIGIGGEVEFGGGHKADVNCYNPCDVSCSVSCNNPCSNSCNNSCDNSCSNSCDTSCTTTGCNYPTATQTCDSLKTCCSNVALTQWGVWLKLGSSYN